MKIIQSEYPEDLEPGKYIDHVATCPFCGQRVFVRADPQADEEQLTRLAAESCECDRARRERKAGTNARSVAIQMRERFDTLPDDVLKAIEAVLFPVAAGMLKKVTFTVDGGESYTAYTKDKKLKLLRTVTEQDEVEE